MMLDVNIQTFARWKIDSRLEKDVTRDNMS